MEFGSSRNHRITD